MKTKILLLFILLFWLLGVCTVLSGKIEEEMLPQVVTVQAGAQQLSDPNSKMKLPLGCLQAEENGMHLYRLAEGSGWEAGTYVVFQVCLSVLLLFGEEAISDRRIHEHSRP